MRSIVVCTTCRFSPAAKIGPDGRTGGEILLAHVKNAAEGHGVSVTEQACLWNCTRPCSVVFQDSERFSYVTGGHEPVPEQAAAIVEWFKAHGESAHGEVPFRQWPQRMRGHFIARMPPVKP